jgi:regulator of sirC expression with transglutaminase-like and TPR domain
MRYPYSLLAGVLLALAVSTAAAADDTDIASDDFETLVQQLDSARFKQRRHAERQLRQGGISALPALERVANSDSAEVRWRARRISLAIQDELLTAEFHALLTAPASGELDIERGMFLVARIDNPLLEYETLTRQLDALAESVAKYVEPERLDELPAREAVEALSYVLFIEERFAGNLDKFDDPANSSLEHVLNNRRGLPILLSQIMISVGRRHRLPLRGLAIPGRYMVKYEPPPGHAEDEMVIDPYAGGAIYSLDQLEDVVAGLGFGFDHATHLTPATNRDTLARILRNLADDFRLAGRLDDSKRTQRYLTIVSAEGN